MYLKYITYTKHESMKTSVTVQTCKSWGHTQEYHTKVVSNMPPQKYHHVFKSIHFCSLIKFMDGSIAFYVVRCACSSFYSHKFANVSYFWSSVIGNYINAEDTCDCNLHTMAVYNSKHSFYLQSLRQKHHRYRNCKIVT